MRDFSPITLISRETTMLVVHPSLPVKSVKDLIALAKARPSELNYLFGSVGSSVHLAGELFRQMADIKLVYVAYKISAQAVTSVISGEVQMTINDVGLAAPHLKSGRLKALAVTSPEPSALAPGLPTVAASGLPGYEATGMTGSWVPAKTPAAIVNRLNQEMVRVLNMPEVKERLVNNGSEPVGNSPEQFAAVMKADIARMSRVIKEAGIKLD